MAEKAALRSSADNIRAILYKYWLIVNENPLRKPFVGDPAYDLTQHLLNCENRLQANPDSLIHRMADLAQVDAHRVRIWRLGRAAAEPRTNWDNHWKTTLARTLL